MSSSSITTLPKTNLRDQVSQALRSAIISGEMEPGVVYSAPSLAGRFGVSATPVREAMLDLVREGMVTIVPNKGFRVTEVDEASLDQVTQIRQLLEPPVVGRVTPHVPAEDLPALRQLAQDIVDEATAGDLVAYTEADRQFHLRLLSYDGNPRLVDLVRDAQSSVDGLAAQRERLVDGQRDGDGAGDGRDRRVGHGSSSRGSAASAALWKPAIASDQTPSSHARSAVTPSGFNR